MPYLSLYLDGEKSASIAYDLTNKKAGYMDRRIRVLCWLRQKEISECKTWEIVVEGIASRPSVSGMPGKPLTYVELELIHYLHERDYRIKDIATMIGRGYGTVERELLKEAETLTA